MKLTKAFEGTLLAHTDGGVPNMVVNIPQLDEETFGYVVYFFELALCNEWIPIRRKSI